MSTIVTPIPVEPGLTEPQRMARIFHRPSATFTDVRRNPSWWGPFLLMSVFSLIFIFSVDKKITFPQVQQNMINNMSEKQKDRMEQMTPEQRETQQRVMLKSVTYLSYAWPIVMLISVAIVALILMGVFNFGMAAEVSFKHAYAIVMYSFLPGIIKTLLAVALIWGGMDPENFNLQNPVMTNPAALTSPTDHPALYSLLSSFDIFTIWSVILMGIGFAVVSSRKIKPSTGITTMLVVYAVVRLLGVAWAGLMG